MLILGSIIGAGFVSGREIYAFFVQHNFSPIATFFCCLILFYILFFVLLQRGKEVYSTKCKSLNKALNIFLAICYFISTAAMLAGINALQNSIFANINFPIFSIIFCILSTYVVDGGIKKMSRANAIIAPLIVLIALMISLFNITLINTEISVSFSMIFYSFIYIAFNICFLVDILQDMGKQLSTKQSRIVSGVSALVLSAMMLVIWLAISSNPNSFMFEMPLVFLSLRFGDASQIICFVVVALGIFTTLSTTHYATARSMGHSNFISHSAIIFFAFILSLLGFKFIVDKLYVITGYFCFCYVVIVLIKTLLAKIKKHLRNKITLSLKK